MKYNVSLAIDGRIDVQVEADNFEEARSKASLDGVDLNDMDIINCSAVNAEDENGVFKDY
jgi:hypothetical protein